MSLLSILRHFRKRGLRDVTNPKKLDAYLEWVDIEKNGVNIPADEIANYAEQITYRLKRCPDCVANGSCYHCGCNMPEKALAPCSSCSAGKWPSYLSKEEWEKYKEDNQISILVVQ